MIFAIFGIIIGLIIGIKLVIEICRWGMSSKIITSILVVFCSSFLGLCVGIIITILSSLLFSPLIETIETEVYTKALLTKPVISNSHVSFIMQDGSIDNLDIRDITINIEKNVKPIVKKTNINFVNKYWYLLFLPIPEEKAYFTLPSNYEFS